MRRDRAFEVVAAQRTFALLALLWLLLLGGCRRTAHQPAPGPPRDKNPSEVQRADGPREVARAFNAAAKAGDVDRALALTNITADWQRKVVRAQVEAAAAMERLRRAIGEHFGAAAEHEVDFGLPRDEEFDDAEVQMSGDTARVVMAEFVGSNNLDETGSFTALVCRGHRWLIDLHPRTMDEQDERDVQMQIEQSLKLSDLLVRSADLTAEEVRSGKYEEPMEAAGAFRARPFTDAEFNPEIEGPADEQAE